jgi:hypothetical protein
MAVLPDYLNLSLLLRISNKQQTDIEYELPDDIRKWEDFQLPAGYSLVRGTIAAGATETPAMPANNVLVFIQTSTSVIFRVTAGVAASITGTVFLAAAGSDTATGITVLNIIAPAGPDVEYTLLMLPT